MRLGDDPFKTEPKGVDNLIRNTRKEKPKQVKKVKVKKVDNEEKARQCINVNEEILVDFKTLAVKQRRRFSDLAEEAFKDTIKKYAKA